MGSISEDLLEDFRSAMKTREKADYSYIYNENLARDMLESTKKLIEEVGTCFKPNKVYKVKLNKTSQKLEKELH